MRASMMRFPARALAWTLPVVAAGLAAAAMAPVRRVPAIVFVSRHPIAGEAGAIPGLGPHHRAAITGGRLRVRAPDGRVRDLLPQGALDDVSDPAVSPDARRIAFAGVAGGERVWRLWTVATNGTELRRVTDDAGLPADDLDPCWIDDSTLVFASTRGGGRAQYADVPITNLHVVRIGRDGRAAGAPRAITAERNGAEEPAWDAGRGEIVFARWWFNRHRPAADGRAITDRDERAPARDTINLWHAMAMAPGGGPARLAAADLRTRRGSMGYQPAPLADGTIASVFAANLGLSPGPVGTGIHRQSRALAPAVRLAGAIVSGRAGDSYAGTEGLAPPSACAPAALPDGRVLFSWAPGARGDFGLYVVNADGTRLVPLCDEPGTLELDAAPIVPRTHGRAAPPFAGDAVAAMRDGTPAFRFHDLDVFANGPAQSPARGAPPRTAGARIRFFATVPRPEGGDSAVLVREVPVGPRGEVDEHLPAGVPMFEQLVDSTGRVLMTAHGPAHVAGFNAGSPGRVTRCIGCHLGHSTLPAPAAMAEGTRP